MRALVRSTSALLCAALLLAGCDAEQDKPKTGGDPNSPGPAGNSGGRPIQSHPTAQHGDVHVELTALDRVSPRVVVARFKVVNRTSGTFAFGSTLSGLTFRPDPLNKLDTNAVSAVTLFDQAGSRRHFALTDGSGKCLCTRDDSPEVPPGQSIDLAAAFPAPPDGVDQMGVLFPNTPPFMNVKLGDRAAPTLELEGRQVDLTQVQTKPPLIRSVAATTESPTGGEDDLGADLRVRLSSDVLFALNKADLSPRAREILRSVAGKIDQSPGAQVRVDGHTDTSGDDAINLPLSQRRALSVEGELKKLVTKPGIAFQSKGHGSADPVASNDNETGRKLNRRVSVSFARPKPAAAAPPSTAAKTGPVVLKAQPSAPPGHVSQWPRDARVEIDPVRRVGGGYALLSWTVANDDAANLHADMAFGGLSLSQGYYGSGVNGVALEAGDKRYRILRDDRGSGLGTTFNLMSSGAYEVAKGESLRLTAMFKLPDDLTSVTVDLPGFGKAADVPIR
ncbi:OmpA family protein [Spirillospora sp. NPDC050679]